MLVLALGSHVAFDSQVNGWIVEQVGCTSFKLSAQLEINCRVPRLQTCGPITRMSKKPYPLLPRTGTVRRRHSPVPFSGRRRRRLIGDS